MSTVKVPCPHCVFRGPVWLDENRKCVYCEETITASDDWIWSAVPWEWWLEEGMISASQSPLGTTEAKIPQTVKAAKEAAQI